SEAVERLDEAPQRLPGEQRGGFGAVKFPRVGPVVSRRRDVGEAWKQLAVAVPVGGHFPLYPEDRSVFVQQDQVREIGRASCREREWMRGVCCCCERRGERCR